MHDLAHLAALGELLNKYPALAAALANGATINTQINHISAGSSPTLNIGCNVGSSGSSGRKNIRSNDVEEIIVEEELADNKVAVAEDRPEQSQESPFVEPVSQVDETLVNEVFDRLYELELDGQIDNAPDKTKLRGFNAKRLNELLTADPENVYSMLAVT